MRLLAPAFGTWLLVLPLGMALWMLRRSFKRRFRDRVPVGRALTRLSRLSGARHDALLLAATLVGLGGLVLAAMRPQVMIAGRVPEYERQDLILILDRSVSMKATDVVPSRSERALREIEAFIRAKPQIVDRIALVAFAGSAVTISHLSRDPNSLLFFLDWIRDDPGVYFGTDLAGALEAARDIATRDESPTKKVFVVVSDGDDHGSRLDGELATLRRERLRVHCIGIGTEREVPIPIASQAGATLYLRDEEGRPLLTRFHPDALRTVAGLTGGRFFRSTTGMELVAAIGQVVQDERRQIGWRESIEYRDAHQPLLLLAALATVVLLVKS